jgi:hypothetical protein
MGQSKYNEFFLCVNPIGRNQHIKINVDMMPNIKWPSYVNFENHAMKKMKGLFYFQMLEEG